MKTILKVIDLKETALANESNKKINEEIKDTTRSARISAQVKTEMEIDW